MSGKVNWEATLYNWTCSEGAKRISNPSTIRAIVDVLMYVVNEFNGHVVATVPTRTTLALENLEKLEVIEMAAQQLEEHQGVWETHPDQRNNIAFEFPFLAEHNLELRYFKMIFENENALKNVNNIKNVTLSYHPAKHFTEIIFYED